MMMFRVLLTGMIILCIAIPSSAQEDWAAVFRKTEASVVVVFTYDKDGNQVSQGSGFFLGDAGDVVTSRDLLKGADHSEIRTRGLILYPVKEVLAEDTEANLIRLSVKVPPDAVHSLTVGVAPTHINEKVAAISGLADTGKSFSYGSVLAMREIPAFGRVLQVMMRLSSRFNGSPLVNHKGEVIGVVTSEGKQVFDVVSIERVLRLLPGKGKSLFKWEAQRERTAEELYAQGLPYLWKEDYAKALPFFEEAAKKDPRYANAFFQIGYCNAQLKHYVEAIEAYRRAIRIQADFIPAHFFLGLCYLELNDRNSAMKEYDLLKKMGRRNLDRDYAGDLLNMME